MSFQGIVKDIIQNILVNDHKLPSENIARSEKENAELETKKLKPRVSLITCDEKFDDRTAKEAKYFDEETKQWKSRTVRGTRILPMEIAIWHKTEEEAESLGDAVLAGLPKKWNYDGFTGTVNIANFLHCDYMTKTSNNYVVKIIAVFSMEVAGKENPVPTINTLQSEQPEVM